MTISMRLLAPAALVALVAFQGCVASSVLAGNATARERQRGQGAHRVFDGSVEDARKGARALLEKLGADFVISEQEDLVAAVQDTVTSGIRVVIRYKAFLAPAKEPGRTDVEFLCEIPYANPDVLAKCDQNFLSGLADSIELARRRGSEGPVTASAQPAAAAPARPSQPPAASVQAQGRAPEPRSDVDAGPARAGAPRPDDFALVVGIEQYQNIPKADYGERDAATMKRYIQKLGVPEENVIFLTGQRATRTGLAKYLEEWLPRNVTDQSRVYFYYSGHGAPDPSDGLSYLVPWDGDPTFLKSSAYPVSRLYEKLGALKAKEVVVMLDSCFSGAGGRSVLAKGARPLVNAKTADIPEGSKLSLLTASGGDEITGSLDEQGHGLFTYYLLKGMGGEAVRDGHLAISDLYAYVQKNVQRAARRQNREQTPQLKTGTDLRLY
jgi:hypothetical protein